MARGQIHRFYHEHLKSLENERYERYTVLTTNISTGLLYTLYHGYTSVAYDFLYLERRTTNVLARRFWCGMESHLEALRTKINHIKRSGAISNTHCNMDCVSVSCFQQIPTTLAFTSGPEDRKKPPPPRTSALVCSRGQYSERSRASTNRQLGNTPKEAAPPRTVSWATHVTSWSPPRIMSVTWSSQVEVYTIPARERDADFWKYFMCPASDCTSADCASTKSGKTASPRVDDCASTKSGKAALPRMDDCVPTTTRPAFPSPTVSLS